MTESQPARTDRVVVISDVHLNWRRRWQRRLERLGPLWAGADAVVFNGDTLDQITAAHPERAEEVLEHVRRCCGADGVEAIFLAGNADVEAVEADHLALAGGAVVVMHGHVVFPSMCPWRPGARSLRQAREQSLAEMPPDRRRTFAGQVAAARAALFRGQDPIDVHCRERFLLIKRLWSFAHRPDRILAILRAWRDAPHLAAELFSRYRPETRAIVMGHTHRPGVWRMGERWVINTGSPRGPWRPMLVRIEGRSIIVSRTERSAGGLRPGRTVAELAV